MPVWQLFVVRRALDLFAAQAAGKTSRRQREPTALVAAGSTIIDSVDQLERHFVPLLKGLIGLACCDRLTKSARAA
jgi:hypothetical protein